MLATAGNQKFETRYQKPTAGLLSAAPSSARGVSCGLWAIIIAMSPYRVSVDNVQQDYV